MGRALRAIDGAGVPDQAVPDRKGRFRITAR